MRIDAICMLSVELFNKAVCIPRRVLNAHDCNRMQYLFDVLIVKLTDRHTPVGLVTRVLGLSTRG